MVWVFIRNLISGPEELDAVHTLQNGYTIQPLSDFTAGKAPTPPKGFPDGAKEFETKTMPDGIAYFEQLMTSFKRKPSRNTTMACSISFLS